MKVEDEQYKQSLLNEVANNVSALQGKAIITIDGQVVDDNFLIDESIGYLEELKKAADNAQDPTQDTIND